MLLSLRSFHKGNFSGNFLVVLFLSFLSKLIKTTTMINNSIQFRESSIDGC